MSQALFTTFEFQDTVATNNALLASGNWALDYIHINYHLLNATAAGLSSFRLNLSSNTYAIWKNTFYVQAPAAGSLTAAMFGFPVVELVFPKPLILARGDGVSITSSVLTNVTLVAYGVTIFGENLQ